MRKLSLRLGWCISIRLNPCLHGPWNPMFSRHFNWFETGSS
jgi:hypothetical protein